MNTTAPSLQYGSICSGIEAVSLAWQPLGLQPLWFAEIDAFPCAVLAHHYPDIPNLGDMSRIADRVRAGIVPAPDILVGGTPCQSFSVAGCRRGLSDPRGALTLNYVELANAIDQARQHAHRPPAVLVWENVCGVLSDRTNAFGCLLGALAGESCALEPPGGKWTHSGGVSGPQRRIAWRVLDAQFFGVAQRRRRVFLVASGRNDLDPGSVLFEREGVYRHPAPRYAPGEDVAAAAASGTGPEGRYAGLSASYRTATIAFGGGHTRGPIDVAACLVAAPGSKHDFEVETFLLQLAADDIRYPRDASYPRMSYGEGGIGQSAPVGAPPAPPAAAFAQNSRGELRWEASHGQLAGTLSTGGGKPGQGLPMIVSISHDDQVTVLANALSPTLGACSGSGDGYLLSWADEAHFHYTPNDPSASDCSPWRVRRLMPVECERLQGVPDDYTRVPYRGGLAADAPRYKAIGNSMAVPCIAWVGERLLQALS